MPGITDSDSIPSPSDRSNADEMFRDDNGDLSLQKVAHTVSRLHRKESVQHVAVKEVLANQRKCIEKIDSVEQDYTEHKAQTGAQLRDIVTCLKGDEFGMSQGLIGDHNEVKSMITELYTRETGKKPTDSAIEKNKGYGPGSDPFWYKTKIIMIFLGKVAVGLFAIAGLTMSIIEAFK